MVAGDSPAAFEFDLGVASIPPGEWCHQGFRGNYPRGRVARSHTNQTNHTYFANTTTAGARFVVAAIVLLGSPPVAWLIWNLVMFFED